jgi:hypothetical protein
MNEAIATMVADTEAFARKAPCPADIRLKPRPFKKIAWRLWFVLCMILGKLDILAATSCPNERKRRLTLLSSV